MPNKIIWIGITVDKIDEPSISTLSFGTFDGHHLAMYSEVGMVADNMEYFEKQLLRMIEIAKLQKAEMKIGGI